MGTRRFLAVRVEQGHAKKVAAGAEFFAGADFVGLLSSSPRAEEGFETVFSCMLFELVGEQEDGGFMVLALPGGEEAVGGGQRGDVILIDAHQTGSASCSKRRGAERPEDQKQ